MYWKMWIGCDPDTLIVVEADTLDEAFREAREVDRGYSTAQPMTDEEAREASTGYDDAVAVIRYLGDLDRAVLREDDEREVPITASKVYVVMTEVNGYRNLYGHVLFRDLDRAEEAADRARSTRCWDCVYVTEWTLV